MKIITISNFVYSQSLQQTRELAYYHFENDEFLESAKLMTRVIFFQDQKDPLDILITADCYDKLNNDEFALYYYSLGYNISKNDSIRALTDYKKAKIFFKQERYFESIKILLSYKNTDQKFLIKKIHFLLASSYFLLGDFSNSEYYFSKIFNENNRLRKYFNQVNNKYPNPKTAFWLSTVFPGLGQFYLKDYSDGLNSLILNSVLGTTFYLTAKESSILVASISITPWLHRYLTGGSENARTNALILRKKRNMRILKQIVSEIN